MDEKKFIGPLLVKNPRKEGHIDVAPIIEGLNEYFSGDPAEAAERVDTCIRMMALNLNANTPDVQETGNSIITLFWLRDMFNGAGKHSTCQ